MKFVLASILSFFILHATAQISEDSLIRQTFENYKSAILQGNGDAALNEIDSHSTKYYTDILPDIKKAVVTQFEN